MASLQRGMPQKHFVLVAFGLCIILFWYFRGDSSPAPAGRGGTSNHKAVTPAKDVLQSEGDLPCRKLPGAEDVLVVLKTGSTEFQDKLPIHLNTTLRCYPNYLIFSDYAETYHGVPILDALEFVDPEVKENNKDFEIYRRLQEGGGRSALDPSELSGPFSKPPPATGKPENPGWKIDKWKFLPMVNRTLHEYPDKKWYVFIETDTYVLWQDLLNYVGALDWTKQYYVGGQMWIGDIEFAHGGAGFVASRPAVEKVVADFVDRQKYWEDFTNGHWAGDCVLGKAFKDTGTPLLRTWPIWQGDDIGNMNYAKDDNAKRLWCMPTVSYHHLSPFAVEDMWLFEQKWIASTKGDASKFLRHKDVFAEYVLPEVSGQPRRDWNNHASEDQGPVHNLDECRQICEATSSCIQYAFSIEMRCLTTSIPNLGERSRGIDSGWMYERMKTFYKDGPTCHGETWIT